MGESLASFRELKGIGPATEARLHESGILTWETLAVAASALAAVHGEGETLRDVAHVVAARGAGAGNGDDDANPSGGERLEAFVVRMALTAGGEPQRCEVTHVRTMTERTWAGWTPAQLVDFIEEYGGVRPEPAPRHEDPRPGKQQASPSSGRRKDPANGQPMTADHLVVLDAGKAIGGSSRDIDLVVTNTGAAGGEFAYRATLAARPFGSGANGDGWVAVGRSTGSGSPAHEVALSFPEVELTSGIHSLQLRLEVNLPAPTRTAPALTLA